MPVAGFLAELVIRRAHRNLIFVRHGEALPTGVTHLKDWDQVFYRIASEHPYGRTNVFFCGPYPLGRVVRAAARRAGFHFRMEQF